MFNTLKSFHVLVERETGKTLKCLRSDNGGEYYSNEFQVYCDKHGIQHEKIVPYTPQLNGVAEKMNRTIQERVRCMLFTAKLPKEFWAEAVCTACYLINRSPTLALEGDVPEKVWTGRVVKYTHLRVFGCKAFVHMPKELRSKLDAKTFECIFLGYGDKEFGFRLWDPKEKKIIRSRDVVFRENQFLKDFGNETPTQSDTQDYVVKVKTSSVPPKVVEDIVQDVAE